MSVLDEFAKDDYMRGYDDALEDVRDILSSHGHTDAALAVHAAIQMAKGADEQPAR